MRSQRARHTSIQAQASRHRLIRACRRRPDGLAQGFASGFASGLAGDPIAKPILWCTIAGGARHAPRTESPADLGVRWDGIAGIPPWGRRFRVEAVALRKE